MGGPSTIWQKYVSIPINIFDRLASLFVNFLDCTISENALFLAVLVNGFDRAIGELNLFHSIRQMLLKLVVGEFKNLHGIWEGRLDGLGLREVVDDLLVWECLLDIPIIEVHNRVAIRESFSSDLVCEDYLFLAINI